MIRGIASMAMTSGGWAFEEASLNVHVLRLQADSQRDWRQDVLLLSDQHWDNPLCDRDLLRRHMDSAQEAGAPIVSLGDQLCLMQGKFDRRSNKQGVRPEHQVNDYLDAVIDDFVEWHKPYKGQLALLAIGNHEQAIRKNHETCPTARMAAGLRREGGITRAGGYTGWIRIMAQVGSQRSSLVLWYSHGSGGASPVTKGMIDFARAAEGIDADIMVMGHVHQKNIAKTRRAALSRSNRATQRQVHYVRTSTYKDEFQQGISGWHVERGQYPRPLGGWVMRLEWQDGIGLRARFIEPE